MTGKWWWLLRRISRRFWVRTFAYALVGAVTALAAIPLGPLIPVELADRVGAAAVDRVLGILASSMLAVTTFSLSIFVTALSAAAGSATPRVTGILNEDTTSQNVLATFVGVFLFSLIGIIALQAGGYGDGGRFLLFAITIAMVVVVIVSLLRWIAFLTRFGRMDDTLDRVERAAAAALAERARDPYLGGRRWSGPAPAGAHAVHARAAGYVQHVDMDALSECAADIDRGIWLDVLPGSFVHPSRALMHHDGSALDEDTAERLRNTVTTAATRNFDQDPRFGLIVLGETASRALSSAVNDPGTAIAVLGRLVRVLAEWRERVEADLRYPRIHVRPVRVSEMLEDAFRPIARDGAGLVEVQIRLQKSLAALAGTAPEVFGADAAEVSREAVERSRAAVRLPAELAAIEQAAAQVRALASGASPPAGI